MKNTELLHTQRNAEQLEDKQVSGKLIDVEHIEGTPWTLVTINQEGDNEECFLAIGNARLTEKGTHEEMMKKIYERDWNLLFQMTAYLADRISSDDIKDLGEWENGEKERYTKEKEVKATEQLNLKTQKKSSPRQGRPTYGPTVVYTTKGDRFYFGKKGKNVITN